MQNSLTDNVLIVHFHDTVGHDYLMPFPAVHQLVYLFHGSAGDAVEVLPYGIHLLADILRASASENCRLPEAA